MIEIEWNPPLPRPTTSLEILVIDNDGGYGVYYHSSKGDYLHDGYARLEWDCVHGWVELPNWADEIGKLGIKGNDDE